MAALRSAARHARTAIVFIAGEKTDLHSRQEILDYINEYGTAGA